MFVCTECGFLFEEPEYWIERHGLDYGPYEQWSGCPQCKGSYVEAHRCDCCGDWIDRSYIRINDERICSNCYTTCELGDED